jgi:hypothetical protein
VKGVGRLQALGRRASRRWQAFVGDGAAGVALAAAELDVLMPFHLRHTDRGRIVPVGPSLAKLLGGDPRGETLDCHLVLVRPRSFGADGFAEASPASGSPWGEERRRRLVGRPLLFRLQRPQEQEVTLLGQLIRPAGQPDLLVLNPLFETLERLEAAAGVCREAWATEWADCGVMARSHDEMAEWREQWVAFRNSLTKFCRATKGKFS